VAELRGVSLHHADHSIAATSWSRWMIWLGVRCWKAKVALVAVRETTGGPVVVFRRRQPVPKTLDAGARAGWFAKVAAEAIAESECAGVSVRIADNNPEQTRAEAEGAVLASAHSKGLPARTVRRQSLMKPLKVPSGQGAWHRFQKDDAFIGSLVGDEKDAAMASLGASRP
jgi:hypothetical protein